VEKTVGTGETVGYWKDIPKNKMRKGDQVWYTDNDFGFYVRKHKANISMKRNSAVPFGCRKNQMLIGIWDPHRGFGNTNSASVLIPKSKIKRVRRHYKGKPKK